MHTNPNHPKFLLCTTSNTHKLGDRDLLISLQAPLKICGLVLCENTRVWAVKFPCYIYISLAETWAHMKQYFSCSYTSKYAIITQLKTYLPHKGIFIDLCFFSHILSWCHLILILSSCTKQSLYCNSDDVFQCFSDIFTFKPKQF